MSDKRNPLFEPETNIPATITIGKMFKKGSNDYGDYFCYNLTYEGSEHTFFAKPFVHERFQSFGLGTTVKIVKRQKAGEKNATWEIGEVGSNGNQNAATPRPDLKYEPSTFNRDAYREQRIERMKQALDDAAKVAESLGETEAKFEDLRSIAISFVIEENRDRVPLNPVEKPPDADIPAILESIKKELSDYLPGQSDIDKDHKADLLETGFGVRAWQPVTQMNAEQLIEGLAKIKAKITEELEDVPF